MRLGRYRTGARRDRGLAPDGGGKFRPCGIVSNQYAFGLCPDMLGRAGPFLSETPILGPLLDSGARAQSVVTHARIHGLTLRTQPLVHDRRGRDSDWMVNGDDEIVGQLLRENG